MTFRRCSHASSLPPSYRCCDFAWLTLVMSLSGGEHSFDTRNYTALRGESIMDSNLSVSLTFSPPQHCWRQRDWDHFVESLLIARGEKRLHVVSGHLQKVHHCHRWQFLSRCHLHQFKHLLKIHRSLCFSFHFRFRFRRDWDSSQGASPRLPFCSSSETDYSTSYRSLIGNRCWLPECKVSQSLSREVKLIDSKVKGCLS